MSFNYIRNEFNKELLLVDKFILDNIKSDVDLIDDIGKYIIFFGGKRVRPLISILFSKIFNNVNKHCILMSSVIELIHTATLLHDDVIDLSEKRRGKLCVNKVWGNKEAILVGDFLYTKSFQMMVSIKNIDLLDLMANTTNTISEGEIKQLIHKMNFNIKETDYFDIIKAKTACLFAASAAIVPILSKASHDQISDSYNYGFNLGIAYQLIDDILDYSSNDDLFGKNIGDDIANGTFTLPLIHLIEKDERKKKFISDIFYGGINKDDVFRIRDLVLDSTALDYTFNLAKKHIFLAEKAILSFKSSNYTQMALDLLKFILSRKF